MSRPARICSALLVAVATIAVIAGLSAPRVLAHNSLVSSDPADGASLEVAPTQVTWVFDKPVPLETLTVTLIDATGARSELGGSTHGAAGDAEVVTPLPALQPGPVSVRWRLVGPDGHPISGRIDFTIAPTIATTTTTLPSTSPTSPTSSPAVTPVPAPTTPGADDGASTPSSVRWILRYASYLAIIAIVGVLLVSAFVWSGAGTHPVLRRILERSLFVTAALAFAQLLVVASDISGEAVWSSFGSVDAATTTHAGMAFVIRIALAVALWLVLFQSRVAHRDVYWTAVSIPALGLLGTWAFAGHARSLRWPAVGVVADVAHHAAAAVWIAGLAIVGWIVIPRLAAETRTPTVHRFSRIAAVSVAVLVATGAVQTVRLVGGPTRLLDANHGRYLVAKLVALGVMLALAGANRRRLGRHLNVADDSDVGALRRTIVAEFAIGLVIVAITAAMVVSPPSITDAETGATAAVSVAPYTT